MKKRKKKDWCMPLFTSFHHNSSTFRGYFLCSSSLCLYGCFSSVVLESHASMLVFWVHSRVPLLAITENKVWLTEDVNEGTLEA